MSGLYKPINRPTFEQEPYKPGGWDVFFLLVAFGGVLMYLAVT